MGHRGQTHFCAEDRARFHSAGADLNPQKRFYVYPGAKRFPLDDRTDAIGVVELARAFQSVI
jgi:hypothetical protein